MKRTFTSRGSIPALALVAVMAAVGVGYAAIPSANGVINSCYNAGSNPSGQLRVIDIEAGAKCAKNEKALSFNQQGPKGEKGDKGDKGDPCLSSDPACVGPQGPPGEDGIDGTDGTDGTNGTDGAPGPKGEPGAPGISTATFVTLDEDSPVPLHAHPIGVLVTGRFAVGSSWAVTATVNTLNGAFRGDDLISDVACQLRAGSSGTTSDPVIGHAVDRRLTPEGHEGRRSLTMNGGAEIPPEGGFVSLSCQSQDGDVVRSAQLMMIQVDHFS